MELRWYQHEAVAATWAHLCRQPGNPLIVLPTGSGKSLVCARLAEEAVKKYHGQVIILGHRKELLEQNAEKINILTPDIDVGLYSAGLNSRETESPIVVAGIQSVYNRAFEFGQRQMCIIDECHLVPHDGEGMYRSLLTDLRTANPQLRVVGMTATPYRLDCGPLCRPNGIFQRVCYSAPMQRLIAEGFLTNLTTKAACSTVDTSGLTVQRGEFVSREMCGLFSALDSVMPACREIVAKTQDRKSVLIFCSGVEHAVRVAELISEESGEPCGVVTGETLPLIRAAILDDFRSRRLRFLCNVDVLTTGFDSPCIDAIAILRATMSAGLFSQICGRGLRVFPAKDHCLILDFGENIKRHGPIDAIDYGRCKNTGAVTGEAPTKVCPNCDESVLLSATECECGYQFPPREAKHDGTADEQSEILSVPQTWIVEEVSYRRHEKKNQPSAIPTMRVIYTVVPADSDGGNLDKEQISEWVCLEHQGFAYSKARTWWQSRSIATMPTTVDAAVDLARRGALAYPARITTIKEGRWWRILEAELSEKPEEWPAHESVWDDDIPF